MGSLEKNNKKLQINLWIILFSWVKTMSDTFTCRVLLSVVFIEPLVPVLDADCNNPQLYNPE